jgi:predicted outer membrane repeat protein
MAQTCAGKCGAVTNTCQQAVACGSCMCDPRCDVCFTCQDGPNTPRSCVVDPDQERDACGSNGKVCQPDGSCACIPTCEGKCGGASDGCEGPCTGSCGTNQLCDAGTCQACDVCASGCRYPTVQAAITAANPGDTIRICPGIYDDDTHVINKRVTLIGAGSGAGGTVLDVEGDGRVMNVSGAEVELRDLQVTGGYTGSSGGGILNVDGATLTLTRVLVTRNVAEENGGGIYNAATLILNAGTAVTGNNANRGSGIFNTGTVTLHPDSNVSGNFPDQCVNDAGGTGC